MVAKNIATDLRLGDILLLYGELGSGKTYFTNRLCKHLGVKDIVNSPSYVLLNEYTVKMRKAKCKMRNDYHILHYDLYRLSSTEEALELGILDRLSDSITIIEWAELIRDYLPATRIEIYFSHNEDQRDLEIIKQT